MSKPQPAARPTKKPVPAPVRSKPVGTQNAAARPAAAKAPSTTVKKPTPAPVRPQTKTTGPAKAASKPAAKPATSAARTPAKAPSQAAKPPARTATKPATLPAKAPQPKPKPTRSQPPAPEAPKSDNWISRTVQGQVQRAGDYAGGFVNSIGERVNKVGEGIGETISNQTRGWGQGIAGYGNNMKDAVGIGGPRVPTAGNPLGIAGQGSSQGNTSKSVATKSAGKSSSSNPLGLS